MSVARAWTTLVVVLVALESTAPATTYTWTGEGGANTNWSSPSNWGGPAPANNEMSVELVFPALAAHYASNNDLTGLHVAGLSITTQLSDGNYAFGGQPITLTGQVTMASPGSGNPNLVWQIPLVLGGDVTIGASGRQAQLQGPIDLGSNTLTLDALGDVVLAGVVSGSGNLIKNHTSALTITGANTYTGSTTGNGGALYISNAAAFGATGTGTTFNGGFLGFSGNTFTTSEPFVFNGGRIVAYGMPTMAGQVTLNTMIDIQPFDAFAILTMSGTIGGSGGVNKTGLGLLILNALSDLYQGATVVEGGTLQLDTALTSTNPISVQSGAALTGNGSSGGMISVAAGGTLAPGSNAGRLSSSALTMTAGATFAVDIFGPSPITQYDTLAVGGPISLDDATLGLTLSYTPATGQQFTLISHLQDQPVSGTFTGLPEGTTFHIGSTTFGITYEGGSGHDVVLVVDPTPAPTSMPTETATSTPTSTDSPTAGSTSPPVPTTTPTPTATVAPSPSSTPEFSVTPTTSPTSTATPTAIASVCPGDCDGDGAVTINELVLGVNIALGNIAVTACPQFDVDGNGQVTIAELIRAVGNALSGCGAAAS